MFPYSKIRTITLLHSLGLEKQVRCFSTRRESFPLRELRVAAVTGKINYESIYHPTVRHVCSTPFCYGLKFPWKTFTLPISVALFFSSYLTEENRNQLKSFSIACTDFLIEMLNGMEEARENGRGGSLCCVKQSVTDKQIMTREVPRWGKVIHLINLTPPCHQS